MKIKQDINKTIIYKQKYINTNFKIWALKCSHRWEKIYNLIYFNFIWKEKFQDRKMHLVIMQYFTNYNIIQLVTRQI